MKLDGCGKRVAEYLRNADGSPIDGDESDTEKYDGLKEICGKPHGYGYFWFCKRCLQEVGIIW